MKHLGYSFLLALPAIALCALGAYFFMEEVPRIVRTEKSRVTREYRETAEALAAGRVTGTAVPGPVGRRSVRTVNGVRWGHHPVAEGECVWIEKDGGMLGCTVDAVAETDFRTLFLVTLPLAATLVILLTFFCIRYFIRYAAIRDDFLAATVHDLMTPLIGMRFTIANDAASAAVLDERLIRIVENLKAFLKLGGKRPAPVAEKVELRSLCDEAYRLYRDDYRDLHDGADIVVAGPEKLEATGDATLVLQVLWNLYANEMKYAAPHSAVAVALRQENAAAVVEFSDRGPGMTAAQRRRVFDRYYRAKDPRHEGRNGFGIGLATAREFALAMGGELSVRDNPPSGCIFTLRLPR